MSNHTLSLEEALSEALMGVYDNGTHPNALREARAVIARVGESAWAEAVRAEEREKAARIVEKGRDAWADVYLPTAFDAIARLIREQGKEQGRG